MTVTVMVPGADRTDLRVAPSPTPECSWVTWPQSVLGSPQLGHAPVVDNLGAPLDSLRSLLIGSVLSLRCVFSLFYRTAPGPLKPVLHVVRIAESSWKFNPRSCGS